MSIENENGANKYEKRGEEWHCDTLMHYETGPGTVVILTIDGEWYELAI